MISSRLRWLILEKMEKDHTRITYHAIQEAVGVPASTISRLANNKIDRFDAHTVSKLCGYFECGVGDLLQYSPDQELQAEAGPAKRTSRKRAPLESS
jgi:DNA-binding Xre family transcriptional regulator